MAEWSNAPDSKSGVQVYLYRGFESLSFRQLLNEYATYGAFLFSTHQLTHHQSYGLLSVWLVEHRLNFAAHLVDTGSIRSLIWNTHPTHYRDQARRR